MRSNSIVGTVQGRRCEGWSVASAGCWGASREGFSLHRGPGRGTLAQPRNPGPRSPLLTRLRQTEWPTAACCWTVTCGLAANLLSFTPRATDILRAFHALGEDPGNGAAFAGGPG